MFIDVPRRIITRGTVQLFCSHLLFAKNEQKKAKRARYEWQKDYMEVLQDLGNIVGHYAGDGQGEAESVSQEIRMDEDADVGADSGIDDAV